MGRRAAQGPCLLAPWLTGLLVPTLDVNQELLIYLQVRGSVGSEVGLMCTPVSPE